jgi:bifunctional UDP-N-acetylglucosamine pyrophosphorylase/glucosamine-1-phosphate N-acetyltransferase
MIHYVLDVVHALPHRSISMVVRARAQEIAKACSAYPDLRYLRQSGPANPAQALELAASTFRTDTGDVLVIGGDLVLVDAACLRKLLERHADCQAMCTVARAETAAEEPRNSAEMGVSCFHISALMTALRRLSPRQDPCAWSLPEIVCAITAEGLPVTQFVLEDPAQLKGIRNYYELWEMERLLRDRLNRRLMLSGVQMHDPLTTCVDPRTRIEKGAVLEGGVCLVNSRIGAGARVESFCRILDSDIGPDSLIRQGSCLEGSRLGAGCRVGPYGNLRGAVLPPGTSLGSFIDQDSRNPRI